MIKVLIADDQALIRTAVRDLLRTEPDIDVIATAADGAEAARLARALHPEVIVMDIRMPGTDGITATRDICTDPALGDTRVLILTTFEEDEYLVAALRAGASGFIGKSAEPDEIADAVRAVHAGDALLSPTATRALIAKYLADAPPAPSAGRQETLAVLTPREVEILTEIARGRSNDEIATLHYISAHTVKTHINRIMAKLDAHDRAQLVIYAYEARLVSPGM